MVLFTCERGTDIKVRRFNLMSSTSLESSNAFVKRYSPNLFCKFNPKTGLLEIWDNGFQGFQYLVKVLKTVYEKFRLPDYRDLADLDKRSFEKRGAHNTLEDECERLDAEWEAMSDTRHEHENFQLSMEKFNTVMENPVIGGR